MGGGGVHLRGRGFLCAESSGMTQQSCCNRYIGFWVLGYVALGSHRKDVLFERYPFLWGFPKSRGTLVGTPILRTIVLWGLYWGPPVLGNYQKYI